MRRKEMAFQKARAIALQLRTMVSVIVVVWTPAPPSYWFIPNADGARYDHRFGVL